MSFAYKQSNNIFSDNMQLMTYANIKITEFMTSIQIILEKPEKNVLIVRQ